MSQIINGHNTFSSDVALQFETVLGISAGIWMNLFTSYQLHLAREDEEARLEAWEQVCGRPAAEYRTSQSLEASRFALATWLRLAEERAAQVVTQPYDPARLRDAVAEIRSLT